MQIHGDSKGFSLNLCIVWVGNIMTPILERFRIISTTTFFSEECFAQLMVWVGGLGPGGLGSERISL